MAKLDLDNDPTVFTAEMTVAEARALLDIIEDPLDLISELDKAQGDVFSGQAKQTYLVIMITP